jgi:hypothetical protein
MSDMEIFNWILTPIGAITTSITSLILIGVIAIIHTLFDASEEMINECKQILKQK